MILEKIKNFDWFNEPLNVGFDDKGVVVTTKPFSDFWQNSDYGIYKNDGHIFATNISTDFSIVVKWSFSQIKASAQCGAMLYADDKNWIRIGMLSANPFNQQLGCVVANRGASDWSSFDLQNNINEIWFRIVRKGGDFALSFSYDGQKFNQIRLLHHSDITKEVRVGAFACSPKEDSFCCVLEDIDIKKPL